MAIRYKAWLQLERVDDDAGSYEDASGPYCIGDFDDYPSADRFVKSLVTVLQPEGNDDIVFPLDPDANDGFSEED